MSGSLIPNAHRAHPAHTSNGSGGNVRILLRPVLVPELGLVVLRPGCESMQVFHNPRVLVEPEPKSMRNLPSGVVPAVRQPLVEDKTLLPFFSNARVIRAAGGAGALSDWLLRHIKSCQWPHGDYHHSETVIHRYGTGAMVLCWHCDNQLRDQTSESLEQLAHQNLSAWMIDVIGHAISGTQERELSLAELSWWAVRNQVADALPEAVLRRSLGLRAEKIRSMYRESDIVPGEQTATSILKQRTKNLAPLPHAPRYTGYGFEVRKNGVLIASRETKGAIPGSYSAVIDMPSGGGSVTLEFKIFQKGNQGAGNITDCTVIVTKKAASGISIR